MSALDILLRSEIPQPQQKLFKLKRLSEAYGEDVLFTLQEIGFSRVAELKKLHEHSDDIEIHIMLAGIVEPDMKNRELLEKYNAVTPAELAKKMLLPGEITDLAREVEKLSGFRTATLEEVKKN